jgi:GntR family transcriptional regulator
MYRMYEMDYGIRMISAEEKIKAVSADRESASFLKIDQKMPLLSVERLAYTYDQKPIEWRYGLCFTQDHYYWAELD